MAQGRGNAIPPLVLLLSLLQSCCWLWQQACATSYTVGNSAGWNLGVDYTQWVAGKTFKVGDVLFFPYTKGEHDVVVVDKTGYDSCTAGASAITYSAGNTNITLTAAGDSYYFCSVIGHCAAGMKLAVTVAAGAPSSAPTPATARAPAPSTATAPAPKATPTSAPGPAHKASPKRAPTPAPTPHSHHHTPVPAPAPSLEAPSSSVSPASTSATPSSSTPGSTNSTAPLASSVPSLDCGGIGLLALLGLALAL